MYTIYNKNRRATKMTYQNYEAARQALRKKLRKQIEPSFLTRSSGQPWDVWAGYSYRDLGYSIRKV